MTEAALRLQKRIALAQNSGLAQAPSNWDPELIYVECTRCGQPVLWKPGKSTSLLVQAGIDPKDLDAGCLILSRGCPACTHGAAFYETKVVRLVQAQPPEIRRGKISGRS